MDSVENYLPKIHRAITAMFNHKKTVMARTAKKEDTSTYSFSKKKAVSHSLSRNSFLFSLLAAGAAASTATC